MPTGPVTPWNWIAAAEAVVATMPHWEDVGYHPTILVGRPKGDLSRCDCPDDSKAGGQVLVTAAPVFYAGDEFPSSGLRRPKPFAGCSDEWGVPITVEYARCHPTMDPQDSKSFLKPEEIRKYAEGIYRDAWAIWNALLCAEKPWRRKIGTAVIGGWGPIERDIGACSGFTFNFTGKVSPCEPCPTTTD